VREAREGGAPAESPLDPLFRSIEKLAAHASYLLTIRADALRLKARRATRAAALGVLALVAGAALTVAAVVELVSGMAAGLGNVLGARWIGGIATGAILLAGIGIAAALVLRRAMRKHRDQTVARYERRKASQRRRFGHDFSHLVHRNGGSV
jgi:hypothetical protein